MAMRFFAKQRNVKRDGQRNSPTAEVETRSEVLIIQTQAKGSGSRDPFYPRSSPSPPRRKEQQCNASPKRRGVQSLIKSPRSREGKEFASTAAAPASFGFGPRRGGEGGGRGPLSPRSWRKTAADVPEKRQTGHNVEARGGRNANGRERSTTPRQSPRNSPRSSPRNSPGPSPSRRSTPNDARAIAAPSILHRSKNRRSPFAKTPTSSPTMFDMSPQAAYSARRVQFQSSGSSVASQSTAASGVHLMAGGCGNSVASSSAMSSSDNRESNNVFDRVLNMVVAEERERLNAMGMMSDAHDDPGSSSDDRASRAADAAARRAAASASGFGMGDLAAVASTSPRRRRAPSPIRVDAGIDAVDSDEAPVAGTLDTGAGWDAGALQRFGCVGGDDAPAGDFDAGDCEYHDLNDDDIDEQRWGELSAAATMTTLGVEEGVEALKVDSSRRVRSSPTRRSPVVLEEFRDSNSWRSCPSGYRRSASDSNGGDRTPRRSRGQKGAGGGKKTSKNFWGDKKRDFESDDWVAFDEQSPPSDDRTASGGVSDMVAF